MNKKINEARSAFKRLIRKNTVYNIILISLLVFILLSIVYEIHRNFGDEKFISKSFSNGRTVLQQISRDANRKYLVVQTMKTASDKSVSEQLREFNKVLSDEKDEYTRLLSDLISSRYDRNGKKAYFKPYSSKAKTLINSLSDESHYFISSVDTLIKNDIVNEKSTNAITYINNHEKNLYDYMDKISDDLVFSAAKQSAVEMIILLIALIGVALMLILSVLRLQKYIVAPLLELYEGVNSIGIIKKKKTAVKAAC